jgi:Cof subfamily protein (haloacid dehalogenase superfamily)
VERPALVATDVDGTLLRPDERVSARTAAVLADVAASGVPVVLVTGRPPRWIPPVVEQLGVRGPVVCANGAVIYDSTEDLVRDATALVPAVLAELADIASQALPGCGLAVERVGRSAYDRTTTQFVAEPDYQHAWPNPDHHPLDRAALLAEPAIKLLIRHPDMTSDLMVAELAPHASELADLTFSNPNGLVEAARPGVSKATGLAQIAAELAVHPADVIAFGDMPNDLAMLRWAGHGVAMANGHPDVLTAADEVTATNLDDGVAMVLERWF